MRYPWSGSRSSAEGQTLLRSLLLACIVGILGGCTGNDSESSAAVVTLTRLEAIPTPRDTIFTVSRFGPDAELFGEIWDVAWLGDGHLAVVDASIPALIVLDPHHPETATILGRTGEGPGEYRMPRLVQAIGSDTLVVRDLMTGRFITFSRSQGFISSTTLPRYDLGVAAPLGFVGRDTVTRIDIHGLPDEHRKTRTLVILTGASGKPDTLLDIPGGILSPQGYMFFAWRAATALDGAHLWFGQGNRPELSRMNIRNPGEVGSWTWQHQARPVTETDRDTMKEIVRFRNAPPNMFTPDRFGDTVPVFSRIIPISATRVALVGYAPPDHWADSMFVVDTEQRTITPLALPEGFRPDWISDSVMIGWSITAPEGPTLMGFGIGNGRPDN